MGSEDRIDVYLGLDVGKGEHHGTALTPAGKKVLDKPLPNSEPRLRELFEKLQARHGTVLVVVDQPASIGALPLAVARDVGCRVAYLPGLTMRRIADLYPGEAKTDARDAAIIADAARTMPHTLRDLAPDDETVAELHMLVGFDDDLAGEVTRTKNRLRGLLTQIHPSLERVLGPRLDHPAVLFLLERYGSPAQIRKAGRRRLVSILRPKAPRVAERLVEDIFDALDEQTVLVPGTDAAALIVPSLAASLTAVLDQRKLLATRIEQLLEAHPLSPVLTSMPGIGVRTAARILIDVGDGSGFATAGHLAAYAGLAPATRRSGSSIRSEHPARRGNKQLKRAFYLAAFASLSQPDSRAYYDKKRREGKHHVAALVCLARRRIDVLFAMLRDGTFYEPPSSSQAALSRGRPRAPQCEPGNCSAAPSLSLPLSPRWPGCTVAWRGSPSPTCPSGLLLHCPHEERGPDDFDSMVDTELARHGMPVLGRLPHPPRRSPHRTVLDHLPAEQRAFVIEQSTRVRRGLGPA